MYWLKCNLLSRIVIRIYLDSDDIKKELNEQEIVIVNWKAASLYNVLAAKSPLQLTKLEAEALFPNYLISFNLSALLKPGKENIREGFQKKSMEKSMEISIRGGGSNPFRIFFFRAE